MTLVTVVKMSSLYDFTSKEPRVVTEKKIFSAVVKNVATT